MNPTPRLSISDPWCIFSFMLRQATLDLLFPRCCGGCGGAAEPGGGHLCWDCRAELRPIGAPFCSLCGNPVEGRIDHVYTCFHCEESRPRFDRARSAVRFEGAITHLIRQFKYHHALWLQEELVDLLQAAAVAHYEGLAWDAVCAVPLHHVRQRERGFNQAGLLADSLARRLSLPVRASGLVRRRATGTQTHLTARERLSNVKGAFEVRWAARWRGLRLLLVDDVMTTGATVSACAGALKDAGATSVHVITLARGA